MAEDRGFFHHKKDDGDAAYAKTATTYTGGSPRGSYTETTVVTGVGSGPGGIDYWKEEKHHRHLEELGKLGAAAAGAYAMVTFCLLFSCDNSGSTLHLSSDDQKQLT